MEYPDQKHLLRYSQVLIVYSSITDCQELKLASIRILTLELEKYPISVTQTWTIYSENPTASINSNCRRNKGEDCYLDETYERMRRLSCCSYYE